MSTDQLKKTRGDGCWEDKRPVKKRETVSGDIFVITWRHKSGFAPMEIQEELCYCSRLNYRRKIILAHEKPWVGGMFSFICAYICPWNAGQRMKTIVLSYENGKIPSVV